MIKAILACDDVGGIGLNNTMPWPHNTLDMQWFKKCTSDQIVVMGSKTWNSTGMPKPLPNRVNYVFSNSTTEFPGSDGVLSGDPVSELLNLKYANPKKTIWIIGGANLIEQCWSIIDEFYLSRIPGNYKCDTVIDLNKFKKYILTSEEVHDTVTFQIYKYIRVRFP